MILNKKAFTVVELMVVTLILSILWTIWFISYYSSIIWVRDSSKLIIIEWLNKWLDIYKSKDQLPFPSKRLKIYSSWALSTQKELIAYQWELWEDQFNKIWYNFSQSIKNIDKYQIFYYMTSDRKNYQLMTFLDDISNVPNFWIQEVDSYQEFKEKTPILYWENLWILTDYNNTPVNMISKYKDKWSVDLTDTDKTDIFKAHIYNFKSFTFEWEILGSKLMTISMKWKYWPPQDCPRWFLWVWWDVDFNQKGFCVAKYEITYADWTWTMDEIHNAYIFDDTEKIESKIWYPIVKLTINQALSSCKKLWRNYHLVTNNQRMSIARDIEFEMKNWSNKEEWNENISYKTIDNWYIYNWNSNNSSSNTNFPWCDTSWYEGTKPGNKTWPTSTQEWCNEKRSFYLSTWDSIWDFSWNVDEFVNKDNDTSITSAWESEMNINDQNFDNSTDINLIKNYWPITWLTTIYNWIGWIEKINWESDYSIIYRWWSSVQYATKYSWIYSLKIDNYNYLSNRIWFRCARTW